MSILCGKCHNPHDTVDDVKVCHGLLEREPVVPFSPPFIPSTDRQRHYVGLLNGDAVYAAKLSKEACSQYITDLKRGVGVTSPTEAPRQARQEPKPDPKLDMFNVLLPSLPDGRYAMREDETRPFSFFRVKRHTRGKLNGCTTIQTQHSERLIRAATQWPQGWWRFEGQLSKERLLDLMLFICLDPKQAAYNYAKELNRCGICGKELTDERSRWYGIGPDCETRHYNHIEWVDEQQGMTYEQARARLLV